MQCAERVQLQSNYKVASASLDASRVQFLQRIGICPKSEFLVLRDELDRASAEAERARAALDAHVREHICMVQRNTIPQG
jgi:hypothetical protein